MLVELQDPCDRALEERAVVTHDDDATGEVVEEPLEALQSGEVEVVGRLVEEEHVEPAQQDRGQRRARGLAPRERVGGNVEQVLGHSEVGDHAAGARVEIGSPGTEVRVERSAVGVGDGVVARGRCQGRGRALELRLGRGDARSAGQERRQGLARPFGLLGQVADPQRRRCRDDRSPIGPVEAGQEPEQGRLAHAVGPHHAEPGPGPDGDVDGIEDGDTAPRPREVTGDEREGGGRTGGRHTGSQGCAERAAGGAGSTGYIWFTVAGPRSGAAPILAPMPARGKAHDPRLREELLAMGDGSDGASRAEHADRLWAILDDYEAWPGRSLVGDDGARAAWLVAQVAIEDVGLQRRCLEMLELAVACGDADPVHLAYLLDRVRMSDGLDQLHGSQFVLAEHGGLEPWPLDDLAAVDARRARLGLCPFAEHAATMSARWRAERAGRPESA